MVSANRLKVARIGHDLGDFREFLQLVGHRVVAKQKDVWNGETVRTNWRVGWNLWGCGVCNNGVRERVKEGNEMKMCC